MTRTQGIVFDMDGVRIDSEELHAHAKRIAFAHAGIALSDADLRSYVGRSDAVMIDEIGARYGLTDGQRSTVLNGKPLTEEERLLLNNLPKDPPLFQNSGGYAEFPPIVVPRDVTYEASATGARPETNAESQVWFLPPLHRHRKVGLRPFGYAIADVLFSRTNGKSSTLVIWVTVKNQRHTSAIWGLDY